jgi:hypothetical protein
MACLSNVAITRFGGSGSYGRLRRGNALRQRLGRMVPCLPLAALLLLSPACLPREGPPHRVVRDFYEVIRTTNTTGAPSPEQLQALTPFLGAELRSLLAEARALHDAEAAAAPDEKPAFADGDLFTSLFEGHTRLQIVAHSRTADLHRIGVRFTYDAAPPSISWTDHVIVRPERGQPVIVDVEFGGDWPFANQGSLVAWLRAALHDTDAEVVSRSGSALVLRLGSRTVELVDDTAATDAYVRHRYVGRVSGLPFHLVHLSHIEGQSYLLVHESTGHTTAVDAPPAASPDGHRFVTASMDLVAAFDPTRLAVWRMDGDTARLEWTIEPDGWGPAEPRWQGPDTVAFQAHHVGDGTSVLVVSPGLVVRSENRWQLRRP